MGGGHSWRLAASDLGLAGAIGLYGLPGMVYGVLDQLTAPIQIHVAGNDMVSPVHAFEALARHLEERGKAFEMHVYEGAPHAYFDEHYSDWAQACQQTWEAMLGFADRVAPARTG
jgi:carboxymethylenebutenolidase